MPINFIGHVGICVNDMESSLRFWRDGLGFKVLSGRSFRGSSWRQVLELDELELHNKIIRRDHMTLELMEFEKPGHVGTSGRSPMNQLGLTHIAVWVTDIDAVAQRIVEYGGSLVEETRTDFDHPKLKGKWLICCDPNGVRVELVEYPDGEAMLKH